jgi:hypothetical protein
VRFGTWVFLTLSLAVAMGVAGSGASVEAQQGPAAARTESTEGAVVGASVVHPEPWVVEREPYTYDDTYGFTLWRPDTGAPHDHGGTPAMRVALAYDLEPGRIQERVEERISAYPDLPMERQEVAVAARHEGVAVGPIPGSTPSTEVYVPVNGRVYQINVYAEEPGEEGLDAEDRALLRDLRFEPPARPVGSLGLPAANAPSALYAQKGDQELAEREQEAREAATAEGTFGTTDFSAAAVPSYDEKRISEGCWRAKSPFFFQTQHGKYANKNRWDGRRPGWTKLGVPNYWDHYSHGGLGYGRCKEPYYTNDKFAIDYPLKEGDVIFSPFKRGTVTFAGRNTTHKDYGIFVTIKADNGRYVSMSAHLNGLASGIEKGVTVTDATIVGFASDTSYGDIPAGSVHLHQAFYRKPSYNPDGSPYGGAGLKVVYHHYVGTAAGNDGGVYQYGWNSKRGKKAEDDWISN